MTPTSIIGQITDWWIYFLEYVTGKRIDNPFLITVAFFLIAVLVSVVFYKATEKIFGSGKDDDYLDTGDKKGQEKLRKGVSILMGFATAFYLLYSGYLEVIISAMWFIALIGVLVFLYMVYVVFKGILSKGRKMSSKFGKELQKAGEISRDYKIKKRKHKLDTSKQKGELSREKYKAYNIYPLQKQLNETIKAYNRHVNDYKGFRDKYKNSNNKKDQKTYAKAMKKSKKLARKYQKKMNKLKKTLSKKSVKR